MKKYAVLITLWCLCLSLCLSAGAAAPLVVDEAQLLTASEEAELERLLDRTGDALDMDVVVVTVDTLQGKTPRAYADDYYDYNGYDPDGVLLLVCMSQRELWISTSGSAIRALTDSQIDRLCDRVAPYLSQGAYAQAFHEFAQGVSDYASTAADSSGNIGITLITCLGIGVVIGLIAVLVMKGQLKSVRPQNAATNYILRDSFYLRHSRDLFLFRNVTRVPKPKDSSSHRGSSGRSHGGGGRGF